MPGAQCTRSLACNVKWHTSVVTTGTPENHPAFPAQWFYGLCRALLGDEFLFVTVIRGLRFCLPGRADEPPRI
jgi:hypothetical protein